ncbi:MAG: ABC transporter permease [Myxococcaceae bacterium]
MFSLLRLISARHLFEAKLRTILTILGVAVGVATMVGVTAINRSVLAAFRSTIDTIAGKADLTVSASLAGFDDELVDKVKALPGVAHASGGVTEVAPVVGHPGESLYVMGVDLLDDGFFRTYEAVDRDIGSLADDLEFLNSTDRMLVSERFAREHNLKVGDTFGLQTEAGQKTFVIHALLRETGPVKAFGGSVGVMYVGSAQEAFGRNRKIDRIDVAAEPGTDVDQLKAELEKLLGNQFDIERPDRRGGSVEKMIRSFQMSLDLGSGVALLVGVFLVYNTVSIGVVQRRREIGTLRALGATRFRIRALFTLEAFVMGVVGTVLGLPFGVVIAKVALGAVSTAVGSLYIQVNARDVVVGPVEFGLGIALGVLGSMFAALRPAIVASAVQPVEALRRDVAAGAGAAHLRSLPVVLGFVLLALIYPCSLLPAPIENFPLGGYLAIFCTLMGCTLVSPLVLRGLQRVYQRPGEAALGVSGRLAADNFARAPVRTAVPVSALAIGVAMTICIAGFIGSFQQSSNKWIEQSVPADLFVTASSKLAGVRNNPMSPAIGDALRKIPNVKDVDLIRIFPHELMGLRIYIISLTPDIYYAYAKPTILAGKMPTEEERARGVVTISENLAKRRNLKPGDGFDLNTPSGIRHLIVGSVIIDYTSDQGAIFLERKRFVADFKDDRVDTYELYLNDLNKLDDVRREITDKFGKQYDLYVLSNSDLRVEAMRLVDSAFSVTYAMEAVAVLLALLGVINTLLAAVLDRTREIGLLRAIGAGKRHIIQLISGEAAFIGLTGGLVGTIAGIIMGMIVTYVVGEQSTGWSFPYLFPWRIALQMVVASTLCAIIAGLFPARRAANLDVVEALAYE